MKKMILEMSEENCEKCNKKIDKEKQCPGQLVKLCFNCWARDRKPGTTAYQVAINWASHDKTLVQLDRWARYKILHKLVPRLFGKRKRETVENA